MPSTMQLNNQWAPITVLVHVHYPEIWNELTVLLSDRIDVPFRLIVSTSRTDIELPQPATPYLQKMDLIRVENRGRDILPFLKALSIAGEFDIGLKLHTKRSPQRTDGQAWRTQLYETLLPPSGSVSAFVAALRADQRIGFVAPDGFSLSVRHWVLVNAKPMAAVMTAIGKTLADADLNDTFFAAGSMFWFRRKALAALTSPQLPPLFEMEQGQLDGTIAHGMERLFPVVARREGFLSMTMAAVTESDPSNSHEELLALAREKADVQSHFFPAPGIAAGTPMPGTIFSFRRTLSMLKSIAATLFRR